MSNILLSNEYGCDGRTDANEQLKRSTSNRFHVSKSGEVGGYAEDGAASSTIAIGHNLTKGGSEPPQSSSAQVVSVERKASATGRFQVTGSSSGGEKLPNGGNHDDWYADKPMVTNQNGSVSTDEISSANRAVHFSVGNETVQDSETNTSFDKDNNATFNMKSWRYMKTLEHPPIIDFYRNSIDQGICINSRPSMNQLIHGEKHPETVIGIEQFKNEAEEIFDGQFAKLEKFQPPVVAPRTKFGWIQGVFVRCLLNIFGVMLYLRVSWVAGQAGIALGSVVVLLASLVTSITAISTCAICTNGDVKGGGAYFLISRSLGPEFGGSIGLIFSVANAVGAAMYIVGFAETVRDLLRENGLAIIDGEMNDVRIVGLITCTILMAIVFVGTKFESKMQIGLLVILTLSIANYMIGSFFPINDEQRLRGLTGYSFITMSENMLPAFRDGETFFSVFAVYFPAATGIMAGANISGDLADPPRAIPKGTLLAIAVTTMIYLLVVFMTGSTCVRDADGIIPPFVVNGAHSIPDCTFNSTCPYGLMNYFQVMEMESVWGPLITAGIFAATLSSALASLVSAPKIFQAVCRDRLFPKIDVFAKGYGKDEEPRRAYALGFVIAMIMILIGELNAIAPIISNFFLASYALINYSCFDASFADSPGFRPGFKYYNMWVSLAGALLCISVMFIISWSTALLTFFFFAVIFLYILHRKPDVNWGSSTQAHSYKNALQAMIKLANTEEHVKNYRPQLLVLTGNPAARPSLVDFVYNITKGSSLMICGYVVPYAPCDRVFAVIRTLDRQLNAWLKKRHVKSFYVSVANPSLREGARTLLQVTGLGKLRPNILIVGFKANWYAQGVDGLSEINGYFGVIQDAFENNMGVGVLRNVGGGLDYSELMKRHNVGDTARLNLPDVNQPVNTGDSVELDNSNLPGQGRRLDSEASFGEAKMNDTNAINANDENKRSVAGNEEELKRENSTGSSLVNCPLETFEDDDKDDKEEDGKESGEGEETEGEECAEEVNEHTRLTEGTERAEQRQVEHKQPVVIIKEDEADKPSRNNTAHRHEHLSLIRRRRKRNLSKQASVDSDGSRRPTAAQRELVASISRFQRKIKGATIDVWWLYDDGGLTLLVPHLLTVPKSYLEGARMRVFTISTSSTTMEQEQRGMAALLSKFRIDFSDVSVIPDIGRKPKAQTQAEFQRLIEPFRAADGDEREGLITDSELAAQKEKTYRQLRCAELLREHSCDADLVVLTLPVPRKGLVSSCLYMAWLDIMTKELPPTLMIRGNQTSVLTFYS